MYVFSFRHTYVHVLDCCSFRLCVCCVVYKSHSTPLHHYWYHPKTKKYTNERTTTAMFASSMLFKSKIKLLQTGIHRYFDDGVCCRRCIKRKKRWNRRSAKENCCETVKRLNTEKLRGKMFCSSLKLLCIWWLRCKIVSGRKKKFENKIDV